MATDNKNDPFESLPNINKGTDPFESLQNTEHYSPLQSAGLGAVQGASLGFADEAEGAAKALYNLPGNKKSLPELYKEYRDIARNRYDAAQNENPKSYMAGNLTGGIATAVVPGLGELNLAKAAGVGALSGLGSSKADLTEGNLKGAAIDTGVGAGIGAAGYGVLKGLTPENLSNNAAIRATKALGGKPAEDITPGATALKEGTLPIFGGSKATLDAATGKMTDIENNIVQPNLRAVSENTGLQNAVDSGLESGKIQDISSIVNDVLNDTTSKIPDIPEAESIANSIASQAEHWQTKLEDAGNNPFKLNEIRKEIDEYAKASKPSVFNQDRTDLAPKHQFLTGLRDAVNDHLRDISSLVSPGAGDQIAQGMERQSNLYGVKDLAENLMTKDANKVPGIKGIGTGDIMGEASGLGMKMMGHQTLGNLTMASGAAKLAAETATGQPIGRLANIGAARLQSWAANTPPVILKGTQQLVQKGFAANGVQTGIQNIYTTSPQKLQQASQMLLQDPATKDIGNALNSAIQNGDEETKNKVLWAAEQNPVIREKFRGLIMQQEEQ